MGAYGLSGVGGFVVMKKSVELYRLKLGEMG
jgi:hypothetical protein